MASPLTGTPIGNILYTIGVGADAREARKRKMVDAELKNVLNDEVGTLEGVMEIDPRFGMELANTLEQRHKANAEQRRSRATELQSTLGKYLRGLPEGTDFGQAIDSASPFLTESLGYSPDDIARFRSAIAQNPDLLAGIDDESYKAMAKDRYSDTVVTPGSIVRRGGKTVERNPAMPRVEKLRHGDGSEELFVINPERYTSGGGVPAQGGAPAALSDEEGGAIVKAAQDSRSISASDARRVQQSFGPNGQAAFNEWARRNGVTVVPDEQATRYTQARDAGFQSLARSTPKPPETPVTFRAATAEELAGYPPGTAAQVNEKTGQLVNIRTPTGAAAKDDSAKTAEAQQRLGGMLAGMVSDYATLAEMGGIVDSRRGAGGNIAPAIASSWLGQTVGGVLGTEEQSIRQQIRNSQPLLLQSIREATNMGARGLDSNKEMEFYLQAASDPGKELLSNLSALLVLDMAYGSQDGSAVLGALPADLRETVSQRAQAMIRQRNTKFGQGGQQSRQTPVRVNSPQEAAKLPSGTLFVGPDGVTRRRP